jgi:formylglycine-generating enzyme required for sulfatase activity
MIPQEELLSKPIKLRNVCLFYLGHIPTFLDIHLTRATGQPATEPAYFRKIFERGIDPDVDNPDHCHQHSEIPTSWPPLESILDFQGQVRQRVQALYESGVAQSNPKISYALWLGFEHEAMHLETLLYMLVQSEKVLPPPGTSVPDFEALARKSEVLAVENQWFTIPESDISIGLDRVEDNDSGKQYYGWDNELPRRSAHVPSFRAKARPITNGEYAEYLALTSTAAIPESWCEEPYSSTKATDIGKRDSMINGHSHSLSDAAQALTEGKYVRTVYGAVPLLHALHWPVVASYNELASCAAWMGGRIPTMEEARSIYNYVERGAGQAFEESGNTIPAVNGYVIALA